MIVYLLGLKKQRKLAKKHGLAKKISRQYIFFIDIKTMTNWFLIKNSKYNTYWMTFFKYRDDNIFETTMYWINTSQSRLTN
jgi:hypothetical protein